MGRLFALLVLALIAPLALAQAYKCVDERGVTQYSDMPGPGCKGVRVDIHASPPMSSDAAPPKEDLNQAERDFQRRQVQRRQEEEAESKRAAANERRCENLRARAQGYRQAGRIVTVDAKGERHYLDDSARAARIAQLDAEIARSCH
jgi:Domain of unknown function (DUF4124)